MTTSRTDWRAYTANDLYLGAHTEDGDRREEMLYYTVCEAPDGRRYRSRTSYATGDIGRIAAAYRADAFLVRTHLALSGGADPSTSPKWFPIQGRYGTAAWSERAELHREAAELDADEGAHVGDEFRRDRGLI